MEQAWMLFRSEAGDVHYFWNGKWPILVNNPPGEDKEYFWDGEKPEELPEKHINLLNAVTISKRKRVFTVPGRFSRYVVVFRGIFEQK